MTINEAKYGLIVLNINVLMKLHPLADCHLLKDRLAQNLIAFLVLLSALMR